MATARANVVRLLGLLAIRVAGEGLKIGEHTREILAEHGYTPERINDLLARKVVFDAAFVDVRNAQEGVKIPAE